MRKLFFIMLLLATVLATQTAPLAALQPSLTAARAAFQTETQQSALEGFDEFVASVMKEWKIPGLAVAVIKDGKVVLSKGYGFRDLENHLPVTPQTLFAIGSNTKSFTVTLLGLLNDDGKLDWDTPVRDYLPGFRLHDPVATRQMTPRDLVTHRSGLPRHDLLWYATSLSRKQLFDRLRYLEPNKEFRSTWQYQNLMFMTAGYLEEQTTGRRWEDLVRERILIPLGMTRSNLSVKDMQKDADFSYPYSEINDQVQKIPFRNIDAVGPAGSINSSVEEMIRYVRFHINGGKHGEKQLLSKKNSAQMQSAQMAMPSRGPQFPELTHRSYGLGLLVANYRGHKLVRHGGGIDGFISAMAWLPDDKTGVVVLSNFSGNNPVPTLVVRNVFDRLLGLDSVDWVGRTRKQQEKARKSREETKQKEASGRKQDAPPTHALTGYTGNYEHPAYGIARVKIVDDALQISAVGFTVPLGHYHYDIFAVPQDLPPPDGALGGAKVTFFYNKKGDIDRLAIPLEPRVDDIVFARMPDEAMLNRSFLKQFAGEYQLGGSTVTVELKGDSLTLTVPGQPTYTLVPDRQTSFNLKGISGFSVEFTLEEGKELATEVTFHQPNGDFVAKRK